MIDYIKLIFGEKKLIFLIISGVIATALSFIYHFASEYADPLITCLLMIPDAVLLFFNARAISSLWSVGKANAKKLDTINAFFITIMYFCLAVIIASFFCDQALTQEILVNTLFFAVLLGPCLILLLPLLYLVLAILE